MNNECNHCGEQLVKLKSGEFSCKECYNLYSEKNYYKPYDLPIKNPIQCKYCPCVEDLHWNDETNDQLKQDQACFRCGFWLEKIRMKDDLDQIRVEGKCYYVAEEPTNEENLKTGGWGYGFGGSEFLIDCFDGRKIISHNLWHNGTIPKHFKDQLPDNARFINESN